MGPPGKKVYIMIYIEGLILLLWFLLFVCRVRMVTMVLEEVMAVPEIWDLRWRRHMREHVDVDV